MSLLYYVVKFNCDRFSQIVLLIAAVLTFLAVLLCNVLSKFSFITLVDELFQSRLFLDDDRYCVAFVMLTIVVMAPQLLSFLLSFWEFCYAADGNNPSPTPKSFLFNIMQATLEVLGLCTFVFGVAGHLEAAFVLSIMPGLFKALSSYIMQLFLPISACRSSSWRGGGPGTGSTWPPSMRRWNPSLLRPDARVPPAHVPCPRRSFPQRPRAS